MEIERKFHALCAPAALKAQLEAMGARALDALQFEDIYFDDAAMSLILRNTWHSG